MNYGKKTKFNHAWCNRTGQGGNATNQWRMDKNFYSYLIMLAKEAVTEGIDKCIEDFIEGFEEGYNN